LIAIKLGGADRRNTYSVARIALAAEAIMPDATTATPAATDLARPVPLLTPSAALPSLTATGACRPGDNCRGSHRRVRDGRGKALVP